MILPPPMKFCNLGTLFCIHQLHFAGISNILHLQVVVYAQDTMLWALLIVACSAHATLTFLMHRQCFVPISTIGHIHHTILHPEHYVT
jgi:hypothetical protein